MAKRMNQPTISPTAQAELDTYARSIEHDEDLTPETQRNYLSDLRQFIAWCEATWQAGQDAAEPWTPQRVTTPTLTQYRTHMQTDAKLKPSTINRHLVSIKRYFAWARDMGLLQHDPSKMVKLVPQVTPPPRWLTDREESDLLAAVAEHGTPRDRALLITALQTGLRADELISLKPEHVVLGKRGGYLKVWGKRNKYREVPLSHTAREELRGYLEYLKQITPNPPYLFLSQKGEKQSDKDVPATTVSGKKFAPIRERTLGYIVKKYADLAKVADVSPHDLRHRFGYEMAKHVPLHRLAQIMGHDDIKTTMIYTKGTPQDLQQAVEHRAWR